MPVGYKIPQDVEYAEYGDQVPAVNYQKFVEGLKLGLVPVEAAKATGVKNHSDFLARAMDNPWVQEQVRLIREEIQQKQDWSRDRVLGIVEEAIDMARMQAVPGDMLKGVQEINKMCGYYAPEEKHITLDSKEGKIQHEFETMDEDMLLELAGKERDAIEAEFERLDDVHRRREIEGPVSGEEAGEGGSP